MKSEWTKYCLGDLYEAHNGLSKGRKFFGSGYPFLSFSTIFNNWFIPDELTDLVQSTEKEQEAYSIYRGDIFVTRTSETINELGMSSVALKDYPSATYNGFTKRLRPTTEKVLPEFIGYYLRCPFFRNKFKSFSNMTTRASLKNEDLLSMEIMLPPIEEQKKIADILRNIDEIIKVNNEASDYLQEQAQSVYRNNFICAENRVLFSNYCSFVKGKKPLQISDTAEKSFELYLTIDTLTDNSFSYASTEKVVKANAKDILMVMDGASSGTIYFGKDGVVGSTLAKIDVKDDLIREIVYQALKYYEHEIKKHTTGSAIPHTDKQYVLQLDFSLPKDYEELAERLLNYREIIIINGVENLRLKSLRDTLLPKLISGELDVSEVNI